MAQANANTATRLRKAILQICKYQRGYRRLSDVCLVKQLSQRSSSSEQKEFLKVFGDMLDEHMFKCANNYFDTEGPFQLEDILISGSISEGMFTIDFKKETMSDTDFMLVLKNIKVTQEDQKKGNLIVKENSPFVNLFLTDKDLIRTWADYLENSKESAKLSSMKLKEKFRKKYVTHGPLLTPLNKEVVEDVDEGPSVPVHSTLPGDESSRVNWPEVTSFPTCDFDFVLAIKCDGWPLCAQEWPSRQREWPNQEIVKTIIEGGFHIVCKSSSKDGDFRLSYSNAEMLLILNLSDLQHKTYRAFKAFVKYFKNKWSPDAQKIICSYHLKTIMLWYCEKSKPEEWTEDTVVSHLLLLIDDLTFALKEKKLPMYFMPKYNLMEQVEEDSTQIVEQITELRFNLNLITEAIVAQEPTIFNWIKFLCKTLFPRWSKPLLKGIAKGNFEKNDFLECMQEHIEVHDQFWMNAVGKLPSRHDVQGERSANIFLRSFTKFLDKCVEDLNNHYLNNPSKGENKN